DIMSGAGFPTSLIMQVSALYPELSQSGLYSLVDSITGGVWKSQRVIERQIGDYLITNGLNPTDLETLFDAWSTIRDPMEVAWSMGTALRRYVDRHGFRHPDTQRAAFETVVVLAKSLLRWEPGTNQATVYA